MTTVSADIVTAMASTTPSCNAPYVTGGKTYQSCQYTLDHYVAAGTQIGTAGGRVGQAALDFGARDYRAGPLSFANPTRWASNAPDTSRTACPTDSYEATLKVQLEGYFGYSGVPRTIAPVCGRIDQDIAGTAQGVWFNGSAPFYPEDPHLALSYDNFNPSIGVASIGTSLSSINQKRQPFTPTTSGLINRQFSDVTNDGNVYCYDLSGADSGGVLLIQMTSTTQLQAEHQASTNCSGYSGSYAFGGSEANFVR